MYSCVTVSNTTVSGSFPCFSWYSPSFSFIVSIKSSMPLYAVIFTCGTENPYSFLSILNIKAFSILEEMVLFPQFSNPVSSSFTAIIYPLSIFHLEIYYFFPCFPLQLISASLTNNASHILFSHLEGIYGLCALVSLLVFVLF